MQLCDLPAEILMAIASAADARDVESLGCTCTDLRAVARDEALWQTLFTRDHGQMYAHGLPVASWPHGDPMDDPWPAFAIDIWDGDAVRARLPPRDVDPWAPKPFAHMRALGKDARWLYMAHVDIGMSDRIPHSATILPENALDPSTGAIIMYTGDLASAPNGIPQRHGYGVNLYISAQREIISWQEGLWEDGRLAGWSVSVDRHKATATGRPCDQGAVPAFVALRDTGYRKWHTTVDGRIDGRSVELHTMGLRADQRYRDGVRAWSLYTDKQGSSTQYEYDELGRCRGRTVTYYANGDWVAHKWVKGYLARIIAFGFSRRCPDAEFAGRLIVDQQWKWKGIASSSITTDHAFWPVGDSEPCRLFRRYVARGLIGWDERVRVAALDLMGVSPS